MDAAEDEKERQGKADKLPDELARRESRLKKIRKAKAALEAEARQKAEEAKAAAEARIAERRQKEAETGRKTPGRPPRVPDPDQAVPEAKAQRNFTDPDSRIMPDGAHKGSFVQAYNAQIAVDSEAQIIVAAEITQQSNDKQQLAPMLDQVRQNAGASPVACSADTGYWSPEQVTDGRVEGIDLHVATGRDKHGTSAAPIQVPDEDDLLQQMKTETPKRGRPGSLQDAQGDCGTGIRTDQGMPALPPIQSPGTGERAGRVDAGVPDTQSIETVSL